jgi:Protein of unknown function (DUF3996)
MKTTLVAVVLVALIGTANAGRRSFNGSSDYQSNGVFGLGLEFGAPDGLNGKLFLTPNQALDFGIGEMYHEYYAGDGLHVYLDYLWHPKELVRTEAFKLPFYIGVGGRLWFFDYGPGNNANASVFGIRVPIGLTFDMNNVPLDIFVQLVPTFDFYRNYQQRDFYLDVDFSIGIRYWFS